VLDVIRRETNPRESEPDYNAYRQYIFKTTDGTLYISSPQKPEHHWATSGELNKIYGF
jgi:hypothetical protein